MKTHQKLSVGYKPYSRGMKIKKSHGFLSSSFNPIG
jgi:hypothetical protein